MPSAAVFVAVGFAAVYNRYEKRYKKAEESQPCKKDIEKSQDQVGKRNDPKIIIPFLLFFHLSVTSNEIILAGHSFAHFPHPTHNSLSMLAWMPFKIVIAFRGQTLMQHPQATHSWMLTTAFLFAMSKTPFSFSFIIQ